MTAKTCRMISQLISHATASHLLLLSVFMHHYAAFIDVDNNNYDEAELPTQLPECNRLKTVLCIIFYL